MQTDFSPAVASLIEEANRKAQAGKLFEAIESLYILEKQTRQAEDAPSTGKLAVAIVRLCYEAKDFKQLIFNLNVLAKKRGQLRTAVQDFVKEAMSYLDKVDKAIQMELLENLRSITEGKMYVELERARLTRFLAKIKEDEGKIAEAADILQEIQIETYGQMDKLEKTEFILEQMRLVLDKKDFIKAQILSNKISKKALNEKEFQDLKLKFYALMIRYYSSESKYLDICKCYQAVYETPKVAEEENLWTNYLKLMVAYLTLSSHNNEQSDLMNRVYGDKKLGQLPTFKKLLNLFLTKELIRWPHFETLYRPELNQFAIFTDLVEGTNALWADLRKRVVEHNIRVIAGYYDRVTMKRLSQLLDLPEAEVEKFVSDLVVTKSIWAKIDRPKGIVSFKKHLTPNEALNEWSGNVTELLTLLDRTCHLIHREHMVHKIDVQ